MRDVTFGEDLSPIRTGSAPQVMATLRNLVISLHRLTGAIKIAATLRQHARNAIRPLQLLKISRLCRSPDRNPRPEDRTPSRSTK